MTVRRMWVLVAAVVVASAVASPGAGAAGDAAAASDFALPVEVSGTNPVRIMIDPDVGSFRFLGLAGGRVVAGPDMFGEPFVQGAIFERGPSGWTQTAEVLEELDGGFDTGGGVTDGRTAVVGDDPAVILERTVSGWEQVDVLVPEDPSDRDGWAPVPDRAVINGDTMVIGAPEADGRRGEVFVYRRQPDRTWVMTQRFGPPVGFGFGVSVDLVDGLLVVGASRRDPDFEAYGDGVAVFRDSPEGFVFAQQIRPEGGSAFGEHVALLPDPAGGVRLLATGEPERLKVFEVYEFRREDGLFGAPQVVSRVTSAGFRRFEFAADAGRFVISNSGSDRGRVDVYLDHPTLGWVLTKTLVADPPSFTPTDQFGSQLVLDGTTLAVLSQSYTTRPEPGGRSPIFVFDLAPEGPTCAGAPATVIGTDGDDHLIGTPGADVVWAGPGDDVVEGLGGDDVVCAGAGADVVYGGAGDDIVYGQPGDDRIFGGDGADDLRGEAGDDRVAGGAGDDVITGGAGIDQLFGLAGDDVLVGNGSNDTLAGGDGVDVLRGSWGDDVLDGGPGADTVDGGPATDVCAPDPADTRTRCEV